MKKLLLGILVLCMILSLAGCACKHAETELVNAVEATCVADGYSGDTVCLKCDETVTAGEAIPALGHTAGEVTGAAEATCVDEGYTGDEPCATCGEILTPGEAIPALGHTAGEATGAAEATCVDDGYTGDVKCTVCGEIVEAGEAIPATGHVPGDPEGAVEATCVDEGYTGDVKCTVCGEIVEAGEAIPAAGHQFEDDVCAVCEWRTPGMYLADQLAFTWDELVANGKVVVEDGCLVKIANAVSGTLVIGEDVTELAGPYEGLKAKVVYVPATIAEVAEGTFGTAEVILSGAASKSMILPSTVCQGQTLNPKGFQTSPAKGTASLWKPKSGTILYECEHTALTNAPRAQGNAPGVLFCAGRGTGAGLWVGVVWIFWGFL